ncbi:translation initiation factor [Carnimonas nigrificans]|uniref:translation initiation factor n=1 Tax=Carnimonas nigrificans TaxID=64323 RepID=UPI000471F953|nr:translation initiation factor [Carnimonas nigrificans]
MSSLKDQLQGHFGSRSVYSTEHGDLRENEADQQRQARDQQRLDELDGIVRIRRETSGRKGKGVTTIEGVPLAEDGLKSLTATLKKRCGSGGSLKGYIIEIQGDHRDTVKALLEEQGFKVKLAGG